MRTTPGNGGCSFGNPVVDQAGTQLRAEMKQKLDLLPANTRVHEL